MTSVACTRPPVSFHSSQLSTVPKASSPARRPRARRARGRAASASWCPRSRGRSRSPVLRRTASVQARRRAAARTAARCGGPARRWRCAIGSPVRRSHSTVVSRWLVMPMAAMSLALQPGLGQRLARHRQLRGPDLVRGHARPSPAAERSAGTRAAPSPRCGHWHAKTIAASSRCPGRARADVLCGPWRVAPWGRFTRANGGRYAHRSRVRRWSACDTAAMWIGTLFALAAGLMWGLVFVAPLLLPDYPAAAAVVRALPGLRPDRVAAGLARPCAHGRADARRLDRSAQARPGRQPRCTTCAWRRRSSAPAGRCRP